MIRTMQLFVMMERQVVSGKDAFTGRVSQQVQSGFTFLNTKLKATGKHMKKPRQLWLMCASMDITERPNNYYPGTHQSTVHEGYYEPELNDVFDANWPQNVKEITNK